MPLFMDSPIKNGKQMPDLVFKDASGQTRRLWDFRQKTHIALIHAPALTPAGLAEVHSAIAARQKTWTWLALKIFVVTEMPPDYPAGIYLIDRYAHLANYFPELADPWDKIEKEYIYLEARQC
jgi:hypothetical protein